MTTLLLSLPPKDVNGQCGMEYKEGIDHKERINKVISFIGTHLDDELSLEQLSNIACFSKYHFHRLFTAHTGLSLQQYVRWLRLKRSALQLIVEKDQSVLDIALRAGFESNESFSRAFKQICGKSPSEFRINPSWHKWEKPPFSLPCGNGRPIQVAIKHIPTRRLAVIEHRGNPNEVGQSVYKLLAWSKKQPIDLKPEPGEVFGFGYDDAKKVAAKDFRFDLAVSVPDDLKITGEVVERTLPAGRYAVTTHKGSHDNIANTVLSLYRDWLPTSDEELDDVPCLFCYHNFGHEVAETELITEIWLLLKEKD